MGELESRLAVYFGHPVCSPWKLCFLQVIDSCCSVNYVCKLCPTIVVQSRYSVLSHDTSLFVKNLEDGDREPKQLVCYFRSCSATLLKEHAHFSRSMHTSQQVFQECIYVTCIPAGHGFHTQFLPFCL